MTDKGTYRRHAPEFKLQLCREIRSGRLGRRDAQRKYSLSDNLIQQWLLQFDKQVLEAAAAPASAVDAYEARIAALERKVGQLTMVLDERDGAEGAIRKDPTSSSRPD